MITLFNIRPKGLNIGNEVIALALRGLLSEAFGDGFNIITIPASSKYECHTHCGLTAKTIYEINRYGNGVIVGGGNLYENGELDLDMHALSALDVPLMLFSLSRGRIYNRREELVDRTDVMPDSVMRALDKQASFSLARDSATNAYLESIGCEKCVVGGCPTIFIGDLHPELPHLGERYANTVFVSIRAAELMSIPLKRQRRICDDVTRIVSFLRSELGVEVCLLCHDYRDIPLAASFDGLDYFYTDNVTDYLGVLKSCRMTVCYRLHGFLPSVSLGTPSVNISYDERAFSLVQTLGLDAWNVHLFDGEDYVAEACRRIVACDRTPSVPAGAQATHVALRQQMVRVFRDFAGLVRETEG